MPTFLALPRELRDLIYTHILTVTNPLPSIPAKYCSSSSSSLLQRQCSYDQWIRNADSSADSTNQEDAFFLFTASPHTCANMLATNRQINAELQQSIERTRQKGLLQCQMECIVGESQGGREGSGMKKSCWFSLSRVPLVRNETVTRNEPDFDEQGNHILHKSLGHVPIVGRLLCPPASPCSTSASSLLPSSSAGSAREGKKGKKRICWMECLQINILLGPATLESQDSGAVMTTTTTTTTTTTMTTMTTTTTTETTTTMTTTTNSTTMTNADANHSTSDAHQDTTVSWAVCAALKRLFDDGIGRFGKDRIPQELVANQRCTHSGEREVHIDTLVLNVRSAPPPTCSQTPPPSPTESSTTLLPSSPPRSSCSPSSPSPAHQTAQELLSMWNKLWTSDTGKARHFRCLLERIQRVRVEVDDVVLQERELGLELERGRMEMKRIALRGW